MTMSVFRTLVDNFRRATRALEAVPRRAASGLVFSASARRFLLSVQSRQGIGGIGSRARLFLSGAAGRAFLSRQFKDSLNGVSLGGVTVRLVGSVLRRAGRVFPQAHADRPFTFSPA